MGGSEGNYEKSGSVPVSRKMEVIRRNTSPWGGQLLVWERGVKVILIENSVIVRYMFLKGFRDKIRPEQGFMNEVSPERNVR